MTQEILFPPCISLFTTSIYYSSCSSFCSGAWGTANGNHVHGFQLYTNTTSNCEL